MSDGQSDMAAEKQNLTLTYLKAMFEYLNYVRSYETENLILERIKPIRQSARELEKREWIEKPFRSGFSKGLKKRIKLLQKGHRAEWIKLLLFSYKATHSGGLDENVFRNLKQISPFRNKILVWFEKGILQGELLSSFKKRGLENVEGWGLENPKNPLLVFSVDIADTYNRI